MSITISETTITHKYLMNKTKWDLASMYMDLLWEKIDADARLADAEVHEQETIAMYQRDGDEARHTLESAYIWGKEQEKQLQECVAELKEADFAIHVLRNNMSPSELTKANRELFKKM